MKQVFCLIIFTISYSPFLVIYFYLFYCYLFILLSIYFFICLFIYLWFLGGPSAIAGVQSALVKNNEDGTWDLDEMVQKIRIDPDCHEPITSLIVVENTQNMCGGKVSIAI